MFVTSFYLHPEEDQSILVEMSFLASVEEPFTVHADNPPLRTNWEPLRRFNTTAPFISVAETYHLF